MTGFDGTTTGAAPTTMTDGAWRDPARAIDERVDALVAAMTLDEKLAQLYGVWVGASDEGGDVAPHQHDLDDHVDLEALLPNGLGQRNTRQRRPSYVFAGGLAPGPPREWTALRLAPS